MSSAAKADGRSGSRVLLVIRTIGFFIVVFLLSLLAGYVVAVPLAIQFDAREEFIAVMVVLNLFAIATLIILAIVFAVSSRTNTLGVAAAVIAGATLLSIGGLMIVSMARHSPKTVPADELKIATEFLVPAVSIVLAQWWMLRRRRRAMLTTTQVEQNLGR